MKVAVDKQSIIVPGFRFAGVACGIKASGKKDVALIVSDMPATAVAAFTTNQVKAAPVLIGQQKMKSGRLQAIVVNSGNANASTAQPGLRLARDTCALVGDTLGMPESLVFPSSTGKIGVLPPWEKMSGGIRAACETLSPRGFWRALAGIMTTDAFPKAAVRQVVLGGRAVTVAGMAKGAGMINPNMATMLCYVMTDASVERSVLQRILDDCLPDTFNAISVDGDTSTNDTLLILANGIAGNRAIQSAAGKDFATLKTAIGEILRDLARLVVKDGEGATRVVDIIVRGAKTPADAQKVARTVAYSPLVKTAFYGGDPNWGRIACAVGYAGAVVNQDKLDIAVGEVSIGKNGMSTGVENERKAAVVMRQPEFSITVDLHLGRAEAHVITSDLSVGYVRFNSAYST
jgi:glutamate N-acetyltransferase / amino-acid N-acetyltransferase